MDLSAQGFASVLGRTPTASAAGFRLYTAQVTASHAGGVYVTELGASEASASKVTWGSTYRDVRTCAAGPSPHSHPPTPYPRGVVVLVAETERGVWIIDHEETSLP